MRGMIVILLCFYLADSSAQQITFRKAIGSSEDDLGSCVRETNDYGFIVAGTTGSVENTNSDIYLFKLDSSGNHKWSRHFGTSYGTENGNKVIETPDSGFIVVGFTNSFGNGGYDIYAIRTNSLGEEIWSKTFGGSDWDFGYDIVILPDGNYGIIGSTYSFGNGGSDVYYIEIDDNGNEIQTKTFGGIGDEIAKAIILSNDNKLMICGETTELGSEYSDGYIIKAELNGDTVWTKIFGGDTTDYFADVIQTIDNNYLAVGATSSFGSKMDYYSVKFDNSGAVIYERHDGGTGDEEAREVAERPSGICSILGYTTSEGAGGKAIQMLQVNSGGWWQGSPQYGSPVEEDGFSIHYTHDNGFIMSGITNGYNAVNYDVLIIKTDSIGNTGTTGDVINITDNMVSVFEALVHETKFFVYTNENSITVKSENKQISKISLLNISGQSVYESILTYPVSDFSFHTDFISSGIYFVKTDFKDNYSKTIKILIKK